MRRVSAWHLLAPTLVGALCLALGLHLRPGPSPWPHPDRGHDCYEMGEADMRAAEPLIPPMLCGRAHAPEDLTWKYGP